ncbi:MAG TPA: hypothetical protein DCK98_12360 [Chloroflexi bacterium]|jgi:hypothetical protein|nr:hypothetical protein [Chloroflexota bacterium]HAL26891.1 hypothetical protein [Chloroflexota bacterium]
MNDDRLISALRRLGAEDLPMASDRAIRGRLETAWMAQGRRLPMAAFGLRRFVPVLAVVALAAGLAGSTLSAGADSPLWDTRIALEDAGAFLRQSNDDRVAYLRDLVQSRTEEAARQEAAGNPGAAAKARTAASAAIAELDGNIPHIDTTVPLPSPVASPSAAPTPANSPSPSPSHSASAVPAVQLPSSAPPTATRTPTATPTRTATRTPSPTPLPTTGTKQSTTITGTVRDAAGTNVTNACLSTSATPPTSTTSCLFETKNGSYGITASITPGQSITLYAYYTDPATGALSSGSATGTAASPTTLMPTITLTPRR